MDDASPDPNNNSPGEKSYSLRPRAALKKDEDDTDHEESWKPRGRTKRRSKQKGLPLSKYRRKTANARERSRMREINEAFEVLRRALPHFTRNDHPHEKTTKIMTLRLAMKYITALDSALRQADLDSDGESLISDYHGGVISRELSLTPSSLSEQSDILDQLFITSSFDECPPPASTSSCAVSPLLDGVKSPSRTPSMGNKFDPVTPFLKTISTSNVLPCKLLIPGDSGTLPSLTSRSSLTIPSIPSFCTIPTPNTTQVDCYPPLDQSKHSLSTVDMHDYVSSTWKDFECLPSPPIDLDDLFIT